MRTMLPNNKAYILPNLREMYYSWETILQVLVEKHKTIDIVYEQMTVKDILAHLKAWQEISIARLQAAKDNTEPVFTAWAGADPDEEGKTDEKNAIIYNLYHERTWDHVYHQWREGFKKFLDLAEHFTENELIDKEIYPWLHGYTLYDVLVGSYEHHKEHLDLVNEWIKKVDRS